MTNEFYTSKFGLGDLVSLPSGWEAFIVRIRRNEKKEVEFQVMSPPFLEGEPIHDVWFPEEALKLIKSKVLKDGIRLSSENLKSALDDFKKEPHGK